MRAGELDERVVIESESLAQDSVGEVISTWATFATLWAKVRQVSGSERFDGGGDQVQALGFWEVTLRYRADITTQMRLRWRGRTMNVVQVDPQRSAGKLVLRCENAE